MKRFLHVLRALFVLAIFVAAVWLLCRELSGFDRQQFVRSMQSFTAGQLVLAISLVVVNYAILIGYDFLALKYIKHPLPFRQLALASFIGHVSSFNFGSLFGGAAARYRLYSSWKLSPLEILQLIAILGITFWLGVLALAGVVFLVDPFPLPDKIEIPAANHVEGVEPAHIHLPFDDVRPLAVILLVIVVVYLLLCAVRRRPLKVFQWEIPLPPPWLSASQIGVACADLVVAATVFFVLFPPNSGVDFLRFLGIFLLAWVVAAIFHVPGALSVLEAIIIVFLGKQEGVTLSKEQIVAVLVVFRAIYYLLPLVIASILFLAHELIVGREFLRDLSHHQEPADG